MQSTLFNNQLISKIITTISETVPGINKVEVLEENIDLINHEIKIDCWINNKILNVKSVVFNLQQLVYYDLCQQLDDDKLIISVQIHI